MRNPMITIAAVTLAIGIAAACGDSGSSSVTPMPGAPAPASSEYTEDLHDPATLERNYERELLEQRGVTVEVDCISTSDENEFICYLEADGAEATKKVHVSPDGQTFISEGSGSSA